MKSIFDYNQTLISENKKICTALEILNQTQTGIVLVINRDQRLIGTLTDGDIRRGLLKGKVLDDFVTEIMNKDFSFAYESDSVIYKKKIFNRGILHLPILDKENRVIKLLISENSLTKRDFLNPVVIMAGGVGSRLKPHTNDCPKPMLRINGKPILEIVIENCIENGFQEFYLSVNYLKELIIDYFGDGSKWGINIKYLEETKPLGTAGSLNLLPKTISHPFIVINGDVLTKFNLSKILEFHKLNNAVATLAVRQYVLNVPFGVVETDGITIERIVEKPNYQKNVNAGVYVLNTEIFDYLNKGRLDMPELFQDLIAKKKKIIACPIHEYWIDIGRPETLKEAFSTWE